jgi:hypothetical protein
MGVVQDIERNLNTSRNTLAFAALILGILILIIPQILPVAIGLGLVAWALFEAYKMAKGTSSSTTDVRM